MGVRGLQTYIEKQCPEACKRVSLKEKAEEHKKKFDGYPELVVDGLCLVSQLYIQSGLEWIYGGQYLQFRNLVKELVTKFKDAGIELVFFFDGTVDPLKQEEWVRRRVNKYSAIATLFSDLKSNLQVIDDGVFYLPTFTGQMTSFYLKELGAKVYQTDREADDEIVTYADKNKNVFGILSQDSDFIIYNTKEYFSLLHLDLENLSTIHYDRQCLARNYLDLDASQLPLFACLAGNHFVPFEKLRPFHQRLLNDRFVYLAALAPCLSNLIIEKKWSGNPFNMNQLKQISKHIFGNESGVKMIKDGLKSYSIRKSYLPPFKVCIKMPENLEKSFYQKFMDCSLAQQIFNLMFKLRYNSSEVLEDVEATPSALIYREVRQRCYWILFDVSNTHTVSNRELIYIEEFSAYHGNQLKKPEIIKPLPLKKLIKGGSPTITDIQYTLTKSEKIQLFWSIFQLPMDLDVLIEVPKNLLIFSTIINFLIGGSSSGPHLKPFDVAAFVAQAVWEKDASEIKKLLVPVVDDKAINLSSLFMRGVATAVIVLGICDYPLPVTYAMPWHFFDGKLFHYLYSITKKRCSVCELCQNQSASTEMFYYLLWVVTNNTIYDFEKFDWKTILIDFKN